jgi:two-component system sensor histidine kinase HydH
MTPSLWLTLVSSVGMALLAVQVVRTRHPLAPPLALLIVDLLLWNLTWLAHELSHDDLRWHALAHCAAALVPALGLDVALAFVGKRKALRRLRAVMFVACGALMLAAASRMLPSAWLYPGDLAWRAGAFVAHGSSWLVVAWLLVAHHRSQRDAAERAHTRMLLLGLLLWTALAMTDVLHKKLSAVPRMSAVGMLVCALLTAVVLQRLRPDGGMRRSLLYVGLAAAFGHVVLLLALPLGTAMLLVRTVLLSAVATAALREIIAMMARRRARVAELALVGRVTAQLKHDLHNPLAALKGAVQVLEEGRRRGAPVDARLLELIAQQTERLICIVDSYDRAGRIEAQPERVEIAPLARSLARPDALALEMAIEADACLVDRGLLARALENLVRNAAEAMPAGGNVLFEARRAGNSWVELSVADDGPGMDARTRERAFDDFYTTKPEGSGLGLCFVRKVAEAHGGSVSLESDVGAGTRVTLRLPAPLAAPLALTA